MALQDNSGTSEDQVPVKSSPQRPIRLDIIPPPPLIPNANSASCNANGVRKSPMVSVRVAMHFCVFELFTNEDMQETVRMNVPYFLPFVLHLPTFCIFLLFFIEWWRNIYLSVNGTAEEFK